MEELLEQYAREKFPMQDGSLDFSCPKIEIIIQKEETFFGSVEVTSITGEEADIYVYTSNKKLQCDVEHFKGVQKEISFRFDSLGMEEGEVLKGSISFVSDKGEYALPFVASVEHTAITSSVGNIKNLFHFANLAKSNWLEAVQVFYSKDFPTVFMGNDKRYLSAYRGLGKESGNQRNLDEFLIEINKKQNIEFMVGEDKVELENPQGVVNRPIRITKNGWGCIYLETIVQGDFLSISKEFLTDDEFLGNYCELDCYIDSAKLHAGNNFGSIHLIAAHKEIIIPVVVSYSVSKKEVKQSIMEKQKIVELTKYYIDFRTKKINTTVWLSKSMKIVEDLVAKNDKNCVARLFQAQLLITKERYNEAKWILDRVENLLKVKQEKPEIECYYFYLMTLYNREEDFINQKTAEIEEIYKKNRNNWKIAWLLLYLKEEYSKNSLKRWALLEELYQGGCVSPIIYLEAIHIINLEPTILTKMSGFDLQILIFAMPRGLIEEKVLEQIHYLMGRVKDFQTKLFNMLCHCYKLYEHTETLHAICTLLIKGNQIGDSYFEWYQRGVEAQLRITRLYEYYMMSLPMSWGKQLPKAVLMYFAYNCNLTFERKAMLYVSLLRNEEAMPEMVRSYREQMECFAVAQIKAEHLNRDLAYLYQEILKPELLTEEMAQPLANILFYHEILVEDERIKQVVVVHDKMKGETRYPLIGGRAFLAIYGNDYQILLQDARGNRYTKTIPYIIEKMLIPRKFAKFLHPNIQNNLGFDLYVCESSGNYQAVSQENVDNFERIVYSDLIRNEYKKELRTKLVQYHYDNDEIREMDYFLEKIEPEGVSKEERDSLIKFMVFRGMFEKAFSWVRKFGVETIEPKNIFRLISRLLAREEWEYEETMLAMAHYAFKHVKYDERILEYLGKYYQGMSRDLRDIWKASRDFDVEIGYLSERILIQLLFSQAYVGERGEIFMFYEKNGTRADLKQAFLTFAAYEYFVRERIIDTKFFEIFKMRYQDGEQLNKVMKLALLRYYSEKTSTLHEEEKEMISVFLEELLKEQVCFAFFLQFSEISSRVGELADHTIIEYRAKPESKVLIHYVWQKDDIGETQYRKQEMTNMYGGIFVKSFILFFGERLQYYITEETDGQEQLTESATISKNDITRTQNECRFVLLNDVVLSNTLQDYDTLDKFMEEYVRKTYLVKELFEFL